MVALVTPTDLNIVDGFIFGGTNFRGLNRNDIFLGSKFAAIIFSFINYAENCSFLGTRNSLMCSTVDVLQENWYPTKIKPFTASPRSFNGNFWWQMRFCFE